MLNFAHGLEIANIQLGEDGISLKKMDFEKILSSPKSLIKRWCLEHPLRIRVQRMKMGGGDVKSG